MMALRLPNFGGEQVFWALQNIPSLGSMTVRFQQSEDIHISAVMNATDRQQIGLQWNLMFTLDAPVLIRKGHPLSPSDD